MIKKKILVHLSQIYTLTISLCKFLNQFDSSRFDTQFFPKINSLTDSRSKNNQQMVDSSV